MKSLRIGVTSPLIGQKMPAPDIGAVQHCNALERAGAEPILLRNDMAPSCVIGEFGLNGLVFSGGGDIAAGSYGGNESLVRHDVDFRRDVFEFALMELALESHVPILGACRGMQVVNVLLDGTLIEDLRHRMGSEYNVLHDQVKDAGLPCDAYAHDVVVAPKTLLHAIAGERRFPVNSIHHQAVDDLGRGLRVTARAPDGVIKAIEFAEPRAGFFLGIQWHPEWLPQDAISQRLYTRFVAECEAYMDERRGFRDVGRHCQC